MRGSTLLRLVVLAGCTASEPAAGMETAACIEGSCFGDLECLSDLCVAPDDDDAGTDGGEAGGGPSGSGPSSSGSGGSSSMDETGSASQGPGSETNPSSATSPSEGSESGESSDTAPQEGCTKIDYLFVIDNSASTGVFQQQLVEALPDLVTNVRSVDADVHVGVVTTDAYSSNVAECAQLGGLVVQTGGPDSSAMACGPYAEGGNYMTLADDLGQSLACAVRVGTGGEGYEKPMQALLTATSGELAEDGGCNAGFLREDSLLVVVIVTDEYDGPLDPPGTGSPGSAPSWYADLISHRGLPESNIVVGVLTNYEDGDCPPVDASADGAEMTAFAGMFTHGVIGGICTDFSPFFADLGTATTEACAGFVD